MKKIFSFLFATTTLTTFVEAQQIFKISQFTQHNFLYNPAAAGANEEASIGATYRKMWSGISGGPQTAILYGDKYFASKKIGLGASLYSDKTGPTSRTGGQVNISYSIPIQETSRIMFGIGANVLQYKIDKTSFAHYIPNDPLLANDGTEIKGDAAFGVYYKSPTLNMGISVQQIMQSRLNFVKTNANPEGKLYRHYFFMASDNIRTDEANVFVPTLLIKYLPNAPVDIEGGIRLEHMDLFWVGFNLHYKQSFTALAGVKLNHSLVIGYAYDNYRTPISLFDGGNGAHEVTLRYFFHKK